MDTKSVNSYQVHHVLTTMCDGVCGDLNEISLVQLIAYLDVGSNVLLHIGHSKSLLLRLFFTNLAEHKLTWIEYFSSKFTFFLLPLLPLSLGPKWEIQRNDQQCFWVHNSL